MPGRIVRVRDAGGREFEATATDARRHGWEVVDEPQPDPQAQHLMAGEGSVEPVAVINEAIEAGRVDWTPPADEPTQTPADPADEPPAKPAGRKKNQAAVIDSESAPTSEGTNR